MRELSSRTSTGKFPRFSACALLRNVSLTRLVQFWSHHADAGGAKDKGTTAPRTATAAARRLTHRLDIGVPAPRATSVPEAPTLCRTVKVFGMTRFSWPVVWASTQDRRKEPTPGLPAGNPTGLRP